MPGVSVISRALRSAFFKIANQFELKINKSPRVIDGRCPKKAPNSLESPTGIRGTHMMCGIPKLLPRTPFNCRSESKVVKPK